MVRTLLAVLVVGMFSAHLSTTGGRAQESAQQPDESTISGCLQAGSKDGEFVLVNDENTRYHVQAGEGVEVAPHVGHRVELTGTVEETESGPMIKARGLTMVSTSCSEQPAPAGATGRSRFVPRLH